MSLSQQPLPAVLTELESLCAIYGSDRISWRTASPDDDGEAELIVEACLDAGVVARIFVPRRYPVDAPALEADGVPRRDRAAVSRAAGAALDAAAATGDACLFQLIEAVRCAVADSGGGSEDVIAAAAAPLPLPLSPPAAASGPPPCELVSGPAFAYKKSTFLASVAHVRSAADVAAALSWLRAQPRVARASHVAIYASVFSGASGARHADCDDDGEAAAGSRLAHLLAALGARDTLIVVTRWFGGVLLGPARFKIINDVSRQLIEAQPWFEGRPR